ncbi:AraC family transcriptional regulator [Dyadobacter chenwenxiniae]|uniref:AraC family transcriptional regulator n=1 Tax=Dyadobacter chenwenxiniae TaxID=2906456 RepID=A0A9X1TGK9_9BACT|nr:AraC family transcriptional regulator [Dyadobacter chenwenxiniae]MCF0063745.1 AraC family transcriptional regulator [Dyadobacter chenwenxiniae]UON83420.1 AraC family transcriptional regulator [Dyadobacter chenwenxiniae]
MKFQLSIIRDMIYEAVAHGVKLDELCRRTGVTAADLNDTDRLVDWEFAPHLWDDIVELTGDELIGLQMGRRMRPTAYGMIGFLLQTCKDVREVLHSISQYNETFSSIYTYTLELQPDRAVLYMEPDALWAAKYPTSARQASDIGKSSAVYILRTLTGKKLTPVHAFFSHRRMHADGYRKVLECELTFNAPRDGLVFRRSDMDLAVLGHDVSLFALFENLLREKQKQLSADKSFSEIIRTSILSSFKGQIPPIDIIAAHLKMHTRTFQRRLSAEKMSYRSVCNNLRRELALAIIAQSDKSISEIAELLGYADHTSFRRAFKNWTKSLPKTARVKDAVRT